MRRSIRWAVGLTAAGAIAVLATTGVVLAVMTSKLPDVSALSDYHPKLPLRIYTADGALIGEFGEERRTLVPIEQIPKAMKDAIVAVEDARFYEHGGIDPKGLARALVANLQHGLHQGASTLTMQVARNVYLSAERTVSRKSWEALLALKLERELSKLQILEIYLNQIYLGHRAYGFAAASETYFGKPLQKITLAEAAMLAGLPKAPSANNPVINPRRARARQLYVLDRMVQVGFITAEAAATAKEEQLTLRDPADPGRLHAEHVAEMVRQQMVARYGDATYTRGLKVYTTLVAANQAAAYTALRRGLLDHERREPWRGPAGSTDLPADRTDTAALDQAVDDVLAAHPDQDDMIAAVVVVVDANEVTVMRGNGDVLKITGEGLKLAQPGLQPRASPELRVNPGSVLWLVKTTGEHWAITQLPEVEGAFVALDPRDGAVKALVGGFDFGQSNFNRATQAWRQPGSAFKPFIYSAALEKGFTPGTVVDDAPLAPDATETGSAAWTPKNFDGRFDGPMSLRRALQQSKNMVTVRVLQSIGTQYAQDWIGRFGFERDKHPANLPMALGAGSVTPMQMASAYAVFANGGYRIDPWLVARVTDHRDQVLFDTQVPVRDESRRAIPARNAFIIDSMLHSVMTDGTGAKAQQVLKRSDLHGKTGTTNDSVDTWFAGYQPNLVGVAWVGHDTPRRLGVRGETGGSLSLPIWTAFMQSALQAAPVVQQQTPGGVLQADGEWYYDEYRPRQGVGVMDDAPDGVFDRDRILDWFR